MFVTIYYTAPVLSAVLIPITVWERDPKILSDYGSGVVEFAEYQTPQGFERSRWL
ncbi:MAG: hypothetical protein AAGF24_01325 [Cyanobacteria bacterium P01_H01_bin.121]